MVLNQEASLYLPFPREEADVDYQKLGFFVDEDGIEKVQVLLVAVRKEITDSYIDTFQQAGINLAVLETTSFALIRTIRDQLRQFTHKRRQRSSISALKAPKFPSSSMAFLIFLAQFPLARFRFKGR